MEEFVRLHQPETHRLIGGGFSLGVSGLLSVGVVVLLLLTILSVAFTRRRRKNRWSIGNRIGEETDLERSTGGSQMEMTPLPVSNNNHSNHYHDMNYSHGQVNSSHLNTTSIPESETPLYHQPVGHSTLEEWGLDADGCMTSGSGAGGRHLARKTLAKEVSLEEEIANGRYGVVRKGIYHGDTVAVKIIRTIEESSWQRECDFYQLPVVSNKFILGFIGADLTSLNAETQFWIVTEFHEEGSLYDYLVQNEMPLNHALNIAYSAVKGIEHLHIMTTGTQTKPRIAHRDLKSKNMLIKRRNTSRAREQAPPAVCIADFGLAIWESSPNIVNQAILNPMVGTKRYMAPEVLAFNPDPQTGVDRVLSSFDSFIQADMYAFALILWETFRRVEFEGPHASHAEDYQMPYENIVPSDPSFEEMMKIVVTDGFRPRFPDSWVAKPIMQDIKKMIHESWASNPSARLRIANIKIKLRNIMTSMGLQAMAD